MARTAAGIGAVTADLEASRARSSPELAGILRFPGIETVSIHAALARVHTFTPAGDSATLRTAGGVTSAMKQTKPNVFTTSLGIGGTNFNVVADTSKSPKTLDVTEPRLGCRWNAVAP